MLHGMLPLQRRLRRRHGSHACLARCRFRPWGPISPLGGVAAAASPLALAVDMISARGGCGGWGPVAQEEEDDSQGPARE